MIFAHFLYYFIDRHENQSYNRLLAKSIDLLDFNLFYKCHSLKVFPEQYILKKRIKILVEVFYTYSYQCPGNAGAYPLLVTPLVQSAFDLWSE